MFHIFKTGINVCSRKELVFIYLQLAVFSMISQVSDVSKKHVNNKREKTRGHLKTSALFFRDPLLTPFAITMTFFVSSSDIFFYDQASLLSPSQPFFGMSRNAPPKEMAAHIRTTFLSLLCLWFACGLFNRPIT